MPNATKLVHWPGKPTAACDAHTAQLMGLAGWLGFPLGCAPITDPDVPCENCANSATPETGDAA